MLLSLTPLPDPPRRVFRKSSIVMIYNLSSCLYTKKYSMIFFLNDTCALITHFSSLSLVACFNASTMAAWRLCFVSISLVIRSSTCIQQRGKRTLAFMSPLRNYSSSTAPNDDDEIVLPEREYGYASKPFTWPDLVEIIKEPNLAKLSRSVEQQKDYIRYTRNMLKEWKTVYDHVLVSKFQLSKRQVPNPIKDGRNETLWEAYPPLSELLRGEKGSLSKRFPILLRPMALNTGVYGNCVKTLRKRRWRTPKKS